MYIDDNEDTEKIMRRITLVSKQLSIHNDELKKIQSQTDKLTGLELIQNINEQIQNLNKNLDLTNKKLRIAQGEQQGFISQLQGYGVGLNADGSIKAIEVKNYNLASSNSRSELYREFLMRHPRCCVRRYR